MKHTHSYRSKKKCGTPWFSPSIDDPPFFDSVETLTDDDPERASKLLCLIKAITGQKAKGVSDGKVTRRVWVIIEEASSAEEPPSTDTEEEIEPVEAKATDNEQEITETPLKPKDVRKRKPKKFAGKRIFPLRKTNPRRPETPGFDSFEIIRGKTEGVSYEDYLEAGGRTQDLRWDVLRKWAEVK